MDDIDAHAKATGITKSSPLIWAVVLIVSMTIGSSTCVFAQHSVSPQVAARGLVNRLLPEQAGRFVFETIPAENGADVFEVDGLGSKVVIRGNSGVSMAVGLQWYMKNHGYGMPSWFGSGITAPLSPPQVTSKVRRTSWAGPRYYLNYCTFTYSMPWWDWSQWEKLIDWMALNGVTMPLSVTGQEAIWQAVCRRLGLTESQIEAFIPGPAYLPFGWMGTLDGWGGPLPKDWIERHRHLQRKILDRERELGMRPVLQGFTGHVPAALAEKVPDAVLHRISWVDWQTYVLDPLDPLFPKISRFFMEEQTKLFGTDHLYAADTFIEMTPPSEDPQYLADLSRAIYNGMAQSDPKAVWVFQNWTFQNQRKFWMKRKRVKVFLDAIPDGAMLVLHMFGEAKSKHTWNRTQAFHGKPWVWCVVQNFGDRVQLGGAMNTISQDLPATRMDPTSGSLTGLGLISEGLGYNPAIHTLMFDMAWSEEPVDLNDWIRSYSRYRYGQVQAEAEKAWLILKETVYAAPCPPLGRSLILTVPTLTPKVEVDPERIWLRKIPYDNARLARAWEHLLGAVKELANIDPYRYDVVNVARQVLSNYAAKLHEDIVRAHEEKDLARFESASQRFLALIRDLDELLATRPEFLLGRWLEDAKRWGTTESERALYERNARRVLTLWGAGEADAFPRDYALKEWSGMLTGFYLQRWEPYLQKLAESLEENEPFDADAFSRKLLQWERDWAHRRETYPTEPRGDSLAVARRLWEKYGHLQVKR